MGEDEGPGGKGVDSRNRGTLLLCDQSAKLRWSQGVSENPPRSEKQALASPAFISKTPDFPNQPTISQMAIGYSVVCNYAFRSHNNHDKMLLPHHRFPKMNYDETLRSPSIHSKKIKQTKK